MSGHCRLRNSEVLMEKQQKQTKSQTPVALVYAVALIASLAIFGLVGLIIVNNFMPEPKTVEQTESNNAGFSTDDDLMTLYTLSDSNDSLQSVVLAKFMASKQKIIIIPITPFMSVDGTTLAEFYATGGVVSVTDAVESEMKLTIDKYMTMSTDTFSSVANIMGTSIITIIDGVTLYDKLNDEEISHVRGDRLAVDGETAVALITYAGYSEGAASNMKMCGEIVSSLINTFFTQTGTAKSNIDAIFQKEFDDANTNITMDEYNKMKNAIVYVIDNSTMPSYSLTPTGTWEDPVHFIVDENFVGQLDGYLE